MSIESRAYANTHPVLQFTDFVNGWPLTLYCAGGPAAALVTVITGFTNSHECSSIIVVPVCLRISA